MTAIAEVVTSKPVSRIFSHHNTGPLLAVSVVLDGTKKQLTANVGVTDAPIEELTAGKVYTIAVLRTPTQGKVFMSGAIQNLGSAGGLGPNPTSEDIKAIGLNTRSIPIDDSVPLSSTDIFSYEFYVNGSWSDAQIQNYLATL